MPARTSPHRIFHSPEACDWGMPFSGQNLRVFPCSQRILLLFHFFQELTMIQVRIDAAQRNKLRVIAHFGNRSTGKDNDLIRMLQRRDAVRDDDVGLSCAQRI